MDKVVIAGCILGFIACLFGAFISGLILGAKGWNAHVFIEPSKKQPVEKKTSWPTSLPMKDDDK